jgi:hypothetical protein
MLYKTTEQQNNCISETPSLSLHQQPCHHYHHRTKAINTFNENVIISQTIIIMDSSKITLSTPLSLSSLLSMLIKTIINNIND